MLHIMGADYGTMQRVAKLKDHPRGGTSRGLDTDCFFTDALKETRGGKWMVATNGWRCVSGEGGDCASWIWSPERRVSLGHSGVPSPWVSVNVCGYKQNFGGRLYHVRTGGDEIDALAGGGGRGLLRARVFPTWAVGFGGASRKGGVLSRLLRSVFTFGRCK